MATLRLPLEDYLTQVRPGDIADSECLTDWLERKKQKMQLDALEPTFGFLNSNACGEAQHDRHQIIPANS